MTTICTNCGQSIKDVVTIEGKPYGTTCAHNLLSGRDESLPRGFTGDYTAYKQHIDVEQQKHKQSIISRWNRTVELYDEWRALNAVWNYFSRLSEWERQFVTSVTSRLNMYHNPLLKSYDNIDDYAASLDGDIKNTHQWLLSEHAQSFDTLSTKQLSVLYRLIDRYYTTK